MILAVFMVDFYPSFYVLYVLFSLFPEKTCRIKILKLLTGLEKSIILPDLEINRVLSPRKLFNTSEFCSMW